MNGGRMHHGSVGVVRVALDAAAFDRLVAGEMAVVRGITADGVVQVEIILSDISFGRMRDALDRAGHARVMRDLDVIADADPRS
jgi:hypothetical protein